MTKSRHSGEKCAVTLCDCDNDDVETVRRVVGLSRLWASGAEFRVI